jgi:hypothetical protein
MQFAQPGVFIEFDIDQKQAIATRKSIFKTMAISTSLVAGMHLPLSRHRPCPVGVQGELQLGADRVFAAAETVASCPQPP